MGLTETNTEWKLDGGRPMRQVRQQVRGAYGHAVKKFSTSKIHHTGPYKPGGTMTTVGNPWHSHVIDQGNDNLLGNWSYVTLCHKGNSKLTFLTVYRVKDQGLLPTAINIENGAKYSITCCTQQHQIIHSEGNYNTNPKHLCLEELKTLIRSKFKDKNHHIIVGIDANEDMEGIGPKSLRAIMSDLGLHDALTHINNNGDWPPTIATCSESIDHIFCTADVIPHIRAAEEFDYGTIFLSNYPALCLDIDATALLCDDFCNLLQKGGHKLLYSLDDRISRYNELLTELMKHNHVTQRIHTLINIPTDQWTPAHTNKLNSLDKCITRLMLCAERKCAPGHQYDAMWSTALHEIGSVVSYWNLVRQSLHPNVKVRPTTFERRRKFAQVPAHAPANKWTAKIKHTLASKQLASLRKHHHDEQRQHLERKAAGIDEDKGRDPQKTNTVRQLVCQE
jgi:hypothetical protein